MMLATHWTKKVSHTLTQSHSARLHDSQPINFEVSRQNALTDQPTPNCQDGKCSGGRSTADCRHCCARTCGAGVARPFSCCAKSDEASAHTCISDTLDEQPRRHAVRGEDIWGKLGTDNRQSPLHLVWVAINITASLNYCSIVEPSCSTCLCRLKPCRQRRPLCHHCPLRIR